MVVFSRFLFASALVATTSSTADALQLGTHAKAKLLNKFTLLNDPAQKAATRVDSLKKLRERMNGMEMVGQLADQKPKLDEVMQKIDVVLADKETCKDAKKLDVAIKDIQKSIEDVKAALMKKAFELQSQQKKLNAEHQAKKVTEDVFDKLMNAQEEPLKTQLQILEAHAKDDAFIAKFLKKEFKDGDNLAMAFGQALDNRVADEKAEVENRELEKLEKSAHLSKDQAKSLLPILTRVREQQVDKELKLHEVQDKLDKMSETMRFYKKHKAILSKEAEVLKGAVEAIEKGQIDKLTDAMKQLKTIGV